MISPDRQSGGDTSGASTSGGSPEEGRDMGASPATAGVGVGVTSVGHQGSGAEYHAGQQSHVPQ